MKSVVIFAVLIAAAVAAPVESDAHAETKHYESDNIGVDGYKYAFETSNGISAQEAGQVTNPGAENQGIAVRGSFSYTDAEGHQYTVNYVADENGFQPEGSHLPKAQ